MYNHTECEQSSAHTPTMMAIFMTNDVQRRSWRAQVTDNGMCYERETECGVLTRKLWSAFPKALTGGVGTEGRSAGLHAAV